MYYRMEHLAIKKKETLSRETTWMGLEAMRLSDISQTEKGKYHSTSLTVWNLKNTTQHNKKNKTRRTLNS